MVKTKSGEFFSFSKSRRLRHGRCFSSICFAGSFFVCISALNSCAVEREFKLQSWEKYRIAAEKALKKNQAKLALNLAQESVAAAESFGDSDFRLGVSLCVLGDAQRVNKRTKAAEAAYKKSILVLENAREKGSDFRTANSQIGATQLAKDSFVKLLDEDESESLSRLGDLYMAQEKFADAARCFNMASTKIQGLIDLSKQSTSDLVMQQTLMDCLLGLARAAAQTEKIDIAQQSYQRAIFVASSPGCGELVRREVRDEFLKFLKDHKREQDAQALIADVLFGRYTSDGGLALSESDFTAAEIAFRNALVQAGRSAFSEQRVLHAMANLILVFTREGKTADVIRCSQLAYSFMTLHPQANQKDYDHIQEALANYYIVVAAYPLAQEAMARQLDYRLKQFGKSSKEVCATYATLGFAAYKSNNVGMAEHCANRAYKIIKSRPTDRSLFYACSRTAELFLVLNSFSQVEELHKRMIEIKEHSLEKGSPFVVGLEANLYVLYQRYQKHDEAAILAKKMLAEIKNSNQTQRAGAFPYLLVVLTAALNGGWDDMAAPFLSLSQDILKNDLAGNFPDEQLRRGWYQDLEIAKRFTNKT